MAGRIRPTASASSGEGLARRVRWCSSWPRGRAAVVPWPQRPRPPRQRRDRSAHTVFGTSWPVYHHDGLGSGADPTSTNLSPRRAAWTSAALDGADLRRAPRGRPVVSSSPPRTTPSTSWRPTPARCCGRRTSARRCRRGTFPAVTSHPRSASPARRSSTRPGARSSPSPTRRPGIGRAALHGGPRPLYRRGAPPPGHRVAGLGPVGRAPADGVGARQRQRRRRLRGQRRRLRQLPRLGGLDPRGRRAPSSPSRWRRPPATARARCGWEVRHPRSTARATSGSPPATAPSRPRATPTTTATASSSCHRRCRWSSSSPRPRGTATTASDLDLGPASPALVSADGLVFAGGQVAHRLPALAVAPRRHRRSAADRRVVLLAATSTAAPRCRARRCLRAVSVRRRGRGHGRAQQRERAVADQHRCRRSSHRGRRVRVDHRGVHALRARPRHGEHALQSFSLGSVANHFPTPTVADGLVAGAVVEPGARLRRPRRAATRAATRHRRGRGTGRRPSDGGVFSFGGAGFAGSMGGKHLGAPVVGITATGDGGGYWLVASDGGVFAFGDAGYFGSMGGRPLAKPMVGIGRRAQRRRLLDRGLGRRGLRLRRCGVLRFDGRTARSTRPVVGMAATSDGGGYWLVASDGGVFAFGDARFFGSMGGRPLDPTRGGDGRRAGGGYWMVASDGGIFAFGGARILRLHGRTTAQPARGGHDAHLDGPGLLGGRLRRRDLHLRRRALRGIRGRGPSGGAHGGHRRAAASLAAAPGRACRVGLGCRAGVAVPSQCQRRAPVSAPASGERGRRFERSAT